MSSYLLLYLITILSFIIFILIYVFNSAYEIYETDWERIVGI